MYHCLMVNFDKWHSRVYKHIRSLSHSGPVRLLRTNERPLNSPGIHAECVLHTEYAAIYVRVYR